MPTGGRPLRAAAPCRGPSRSRSPLTGSQAMAGYPYRGPGRGQPPLHADSMHVAASPPQAAPTFAANRCNKHGRPPAYCLHVGVAGYGLAPSEATDCCQGPLQGATRLQQVWVVARDQHARGRRSQGQQPISGRPIVGATPIGVAPMVAPPSRTVPACKGGAYGHSARRSYRPRGSDARLPTRAMTLATKEAARGQGGR
ncbi:hypothetical protein B296_00036129 [Ensete ventricosum]|uniref:Uncharacterized protein n=1 Tax=Ensete ventricosum TaxID=4639 RepID=A0A426XR35_ENSVE|nr:hypothetical protein B296_00036129 [Ensete ventricosum]